MKEKKEFDRSELDDLRVVGSDGKTTFGVVEKLEDGSRVVCGVKCSAQRLFDTNDDAIFANIRMWFMKRNLSDLERVELSAQSFFQTSDLTEKERQYWLRCFDEMEYIKENCQPILENGLFEGKGFSVWNTGPGQTQVGRRS